MSENLSNNIRRSSGRLSDKQRRLSNGSITKDGKRESLDKSINTGKRNMNARSPMTKSPGGTIKTKERTSDRKRSNSNKNSTRSPLLRVDNVVDAKKEQEQMLNDNNNNNDRRETVDADELNALFDEDSRMSIGSAAMSVESASPTQDSRRCTVDPDAFASMMSAMEKEEVLENSTSFNNNVNNEGNEFNKLATATTTSSELAAGRRRSSVSRLSIDVLGDALKPWSVTDALENSALKVSVKASPSRRETCDANDIAAVIDAIDDDVEKTSTDKKTATNTNGYRSSLSFESLSTTTRPSLDIVDNRRMTADGADMAALMADLENDHLEQQQDRNEENILNDDTSFKQSDFNIGRESLASVNTADLVQQVGHMLNNDDRDTDRMSLISDMSSRRSSLATVNTQDLERLLEDEAREGAMNNRESFDTVDTAELLASVEQVCADAPETTTTTASTLPNTDAKTSCPGFLEQVLADTNSQPTIVVTAVSPKATSTSKSKGKSSSKSTGKGKDKKEKENSGSSTKKSPRNSLLLNNLPRRRASRRLSGKNPEEYEGQTENEKLDEIEGAPSSPVVDVQANAKKAEEAGLRSCLSSRKMSARKNVVFGSPKAAEFKRGDPTTSFTPMGRDHVKEIFSMEPAVIAQDEEDEDENTAENSAILEEWDRLSNTSANPAGSDDDKSPEMARSKSISRSPRTNSSRRRRSMLQPKLEVDAGDDVNVSVDENTVALPSNLMELVSENDQGIVSPVGQGANTTGNGNGTVYSNQETITVAAPENTQNLEKDLHSLMREVGYSMSKDLDHSVAYGNEDDDNSVASTRSTRSRRSNRSSRSSVSEQSLGPLLGRASTSEANTNVNNVDVKLMDDGATATVQLEANLAQLLDAQEQEIPMSEAVATTDSSSAHIANDDNILNDRNTEMLQEQDHTTQLETNLDAMLKAVTAEGETEIKVNASDEVHDDGGTRESIDSVRSSLSTRSTRSIKSKASTSGTKLSIGSARSTCSNQSVGSMDTAPLNARSTRSRSSLDGRELSKDLSSSSPIALFQRLQNLNAAARTTRLSHCETPLAAGSRMSIGMKRHSMLTSASRIQNTAKKVKSTLKNIENIVDNVDGIDTSTVTSIAVTQRLSLAGEVLPVNAHSNEDAVVDDVDIGIPVINLQEKWNDNEQELQTEEVLEVGNIPEPDQESEMMLENNILTSAVTSEKIVAEKDDDSTHVALSDLFDVAGLVKEAKSSINNNDTSFGATIQTAVKECDEESANAITTTMQELLVDAIDQFPVQDANMAVLAEVWEDANSEAHTRAQMALKDGKEAKELRQSASLCKRAARAKWEEWEAHILENGTKVLDEQLQQVIAQKNALNAGLQEKEEFCAPYEAISSSGVTPEEHLETLRMQLREARQDLESSRAQLLELGDETSSLLDARKAVIIDDAYKLTTMNGVKSTLDTPNNDANDIRISELEDGLDELDTAIIVASNFTWTHVNCFLSDRFESTYQLANNLVLKLIFQLENNGGDNKDKFTVRALSPVLINKEEVNIAVTPEVALAKAFYNDVMCSKVCNGVLSSNALKAVTSLMDVQRIMRRIGGYLTSLRNIFVSLSPFTTEGWSWNVKSLTRSNDDNDVASYVVVSVPGNMYSFQLPLLVLVNGDISSLSSTSLRYTGEMVPNVEGKDDNTTEALKFGVVVAQREMAGVIRLLAVRNNKAFSAFPARKLRKEILKVVKSINNNNN